MGIGALAGAWRLVSALVEFPGTGETTDAFGPNPEGWIVFTDDCRMLGIITAADRMEAGVAGDFERLFKSMLAYSGTVEVDEQAGKFINRVDAAWQPSWVGTEQVRYFSIDGKTLRIRSAEQTFPLFGERRAVSVVTFRRA